MTTAKKTTKPPAKSPNQPLPEGMLGTREVAARLKIEPRLLRVVLRASDKGTGGEHYQWEENDPFLTKLPALIAKHKSKAGAAKDRVIFSQPTVFTMWVLLCAVVGGTTQGPICARRYR